MTTNSNSQITPDADAPISNSPITPDNDASIAPTQQAQPGEKIGRYEVVHEIGRGGMSIVYKARDPDLNRLVAIKLMLKTSNESLNLLRFQKEARSASQLEHPNIVKVHDFNTTDDGTPYLVMTYLDGISLADAIQNEGNFSLGRWLSIMIQACSALEHAHQSGIVHRDIKPSNFVLANEKGTEVVKLVDFGIAKNSFDDMSLTKTGEVFGSPLYMSPEQCAGAKLDARSDIYSLGCVMYEALAGKPPITGTNSLNTLQKHLTDKPDRLSMLNLKTNNIQQLDRVVMRCLEKKPEDRYQNLGELRNELELLFLGQNSHSSTINAPKIAVAIVGACVVTGFVIFTAILNSENLGHRLTPIVPQSGGKSLSSATSENSQSPTAKKIEFDKLNLEYATLIHQHDIMKALVTARRLAKLAAELNLPPYTQADLHLEEAACEQTLNHPVAASEHYNEALALMADSRTPAEREAKYQALMHYGDLLAGTNSVSRAAVIYKLAVDAAMQQKSEQHQCLSLKYLGDCEFKLNKYSDCREHWKQALELEPTDRWLLEHMKKLDKASNAAWG